MRKRFTRDEPEPYPSPSHISYDEDSRWCQEHGHTGLLVGSVCGICDRLTETDPRFRAVLGVEHNPDGSPAGQGRTP